MRSIPSLLLEFHRILPLLILSPSLLEAELKSSMPLEYRKAWEKWLAPISSSTLSDRRHRGLRAMVQNEANTLRIWNLYRQYPPQYIVSPPSEFDSAKPPLEHVAFSYPAVISENRAVFFRRYPEQVVSDMIERTHLDFEGYAPPFLHCLFSLCQ